MAIGVSIYLKGIEEFERKCSHVVGYMDEKKTKILLENAKLVKEGIKKKAAEQQKGSVNHSAQKAAYAHAIPSTAARNTVAFAGIRPRKMPHAHLVEAGHINWKGGIRKKGKGHEVKGPTPPHSFVIKTWEEMKDRVQENIAKGYGTGIIEAVGTPVMPTTSEGSGSFGRAYEAAQGR